MRGTEGQFRDREKERAAWMVERHPGVRFSLHPPNPLGVKEGKRLGMPGIGMPQAIFDLNAEPIRDESIKAQVLEAYYNWKSPLGYASYTHLHYATKLSFAQIFGIFKAMHTDDPYSIRFNINRMGDNVYVKLPRKERKIKC